MLRAQPGCTLFPYTTLFRSGSAVLGPLDRDLQAALVRRLGEHRHARFAGERDAELDLGPGRVGEPLDRLGELRPDLHDHVLGQLEALERAPEVGCGLLARGFALRRVLLLDDDRLVRLEEEAPGAKLDPDRTSCHSRLLL